MTVELTPQEGELLIAALTFAEGAALEMNPAIVEALKVLRPWRSALLWRICGNGPGEGA